MRNIHLVSILAAAALAACAAEPTTDRGSSALTAEQCNYFAQDGRTTICHATSSAAHPFAKIRVATQACVNAHANHAGDFVAVDDDCGADACLAEGAPCDATLACCDGTSCIAGTCAAPPPPPGVCPCFTTAEVVADIERTHARGGSPTCNACDVDGVLSTVGESCFVRNGVGSDFAYLLDLISNDPFQGYRCTQEQQESGGGTKGFSADDARACANAIIQATAQAGLNCGT